MGCNVQMVEIFDIQDVVKYAKMVAGFVKYCIIGA